MARCNYLGWLLILWAILACLVSASGAHAQSGSADDAKRNRYVPIPLRGDIESLLRDRLRLAQENDTLKKFLADLLNRHAEFGLEPGKLDKLDIDNATFRSVLKEAMKRKADGAEFSLKDLQELQEKLQKLVAGGSGGTQGATPMRGAQGRRAGPAPASTSTGDNLARLAETWLRRTDRQALGGLLQESAAFRKGLEDLRALADGTEGRSWGALESLPDYLRFSEKWNHEWADKFIGGVRDFSMPEMPEIELPKIEFGGVSVPSVRLPSLSGLPDVGGGQAILWIVVIGTGLIACWPLLRGLRSARAPAVTAVSKPWPVDPRQVVTRSELVRAFDFLAQLLLGDTVRPWNHRAVAQRLFGRQADESCRRATLCLADLYEQARYTTGADALSEADQALARRDLCLLGGVKP